MDLQTSLVIKHLDNRYAANICVGGKAIYLSGIADDLQTAIRRALSYPYSKIAVKNVLVSIDFTKAQPSQYSIGNILYIQILPASSSQADSHSLATKNSHTTEKAINYTVLFDYENGFVNIDELFHLIELTKVKYVTINSPFSITETDIEKKLCDMIAERYSKTSIYSSRYLMNRSFIERGNLLLNNIILRPPIEQLVKELTDILCEHDISCPLYFLRNNKGMIGQSTILDRGMDTYQSESLAFIYDIIAFLRKKHMFIADWDSKSLYYVHNYKPHMLKTLTEYQNDNITRNIPVRYSLQDISTSKQLLDLLNSHNTLPGPVMLAIIGEMPFKLPELFEFPAVSIKRTTILNQCGIHLLPYILEIEAYKSGTQNMFDVKNEISQMLFNFTEKDGIRPEDAVCKYKILPIKYLNDDQYIIRASLSAKPGDYYEPDN